METPKITSISRGELQDLSGPATADAFITGVKSLSSYNWIEAQTATIAVPGSPSLWSAPSGPCAVKQDTGFIYIAQNAARHPGSPLEPLFRALYVMDPSFNIRPVDIVTDRNNIRKLLSFVNPSSVRFGLEAFTIRVEVTKNTAVFCREETETFEIIPPHEFRGYGHEFEKAYTTDKIRGSTGHHRIISYRFSDLKFIVRHETDGYVGDNEESSSLSKGSKQVDLSGLLGSLSLDAETSPSKPLLTRPKLIVKEEGDTVPLKSTLEIKTRVFHKTIEIKEVAPQLWISQTPMLVRAHHRRGIFQPPKVEDVSADIQSWEKANQRDLKKLAALIHKIRNLAKGFGGKAIVQYDKKTDKLLIRKDDGGKMLPVDLYAKWGNEEDSKVETHEDQGAKAPKSVAKSSEGAETEMADEGTEAVARKKSKGKGKKTVIGEGFK
jgi:hypothetical protein